MTCCSIHCGSHVPGRPAAEDGDDNARPLNVVISWSRIYYLSADGKLGSSSGDSVAQSLQGSVDGAACSWNALYLLSRGSCYVSDAAKLSVCQCLYDCKQQDRLQSDGAVTKCKK